jgi:hypothetical protein
MADPDPLKQAIIQLTNDNKIFPKQFGCVQAQFDAKHDFKSMNINKIKELVKKTTPCTVDTNPIGNFETDFLRNIVLKTPASDANSLQISKNNDVNRIDEFFADNSDIQSEFIKKNYKVKTIYRPSFEKPCFDVTSEDGKALKTENPFADPPPVSIIGFERDISRCRSPENNYGTFWAKSHIQKALNELGLTEDVFIVCDVAYSNFRNDLMYADRGKKQTFYWLQTGQTLIDPAGKTTQSTPAGRKIFSDSKSKLQFAFQPIESDMTEYPVWPEGETQIARSGTQASEQVMCNSKKTYLQVQSPDNEFKKWNNHKAILLVETKNSSDQWCILDSKTCEKSEKTFSGLKNIWKSIKKFFKKDAQQAELTQEYHLYGKRFGDGSQAAKTTQKSFPYYPVKENGDAGLLNMTNGNHMIASFDKICVGTGLGYLAPIVAYCQNNGMILFVRNDIINPFNTLYKMDPINVYALTADDGNYKTLQKEFIKLKLMYINIKKAINVYTPLDASGNLKNLQLKLFSNSSENKVNPLKLYFSLQDAVLQLLIITTPIYKTLNELFSENSIKEINDNIENLFRTVENSFNNLTGSPDSREAAASALLRLKYNPIPVEYRLIKDDFTYDDSVVNKINEYIQHQKETIKTAETLKNLFPAAPASAAAAAVGASAAPAAPAAAVGASAADGAEVTPATSKRRRAAAPASAAAAAPASAAAAAAPASAADVTKQKVFEIIFAITKLNDYFKSVLNKPTELISQIEMINKIYTNYEIDKIITPGKSPQDLLNIIKNNVTHETKEALKNFKLNDIINVDTNIKQGSIQVDLVNQYMGIDTLVMPLYNKINDNNLDNNLDSEILNKYKRNVCNYFNKFNELAQSMLSGDTTRTKRISNLIKKNILDRGYHTINVKLRCDDRISSGGGSQVSGPAQVKTPQSPQTPQKSIKLQTPTKLLQTPTKLPQKSIKLQTPTQPAEGPAAGAAGAAGAAAAAARAARAKAAESIKNAHSNVDLNLSPSTIKDETLIADINYLKTAINLLKTQPTLLSDDSTIDAAAIDVAAINADIVDAAIKIDSFTRKIFTFLDAEYDKFKNPDEPDPTIISKNIKIKDVSDNIIYEYSNIESNMKTYFQYKETQEGGAAAQKRKAKGQKPEDDYEDAEAEDGAATVPVGAKRTWDDRADAEAEDDAAARVVKLPTRHIRPVYPINVLENQAIGYIDPLRGGVDIIAILTRYQGFLNELYKRKEDFIPLTPTPPHDDVDVSMGLDDASINMILPSKAADKYDFEEPLILFYDKYFMVEDDNENILNIIIKDLELLRELISWKDNIIGNVQLINSVNKILYQDAIESAADGAPADMDTDDGAAAAVVAPTESSSRHENSDDYSDVEQTPGYPYRQRDRKDTGKNKSTPNKNKENKKGGKSSKRNRRKPKSTRKHKKSINKKSTKKKVKKQKKTHKRR